MYKFLKNSQLKKRVRQSEQGFSVMELLISTGITVGIITMSLQLLNQSQNLFQKQSGRMTAQSRARKVINLITADVRATGLLPNLDPGGNVVPGLAGAYKDRIQMVGDRNSDGAVNEVTATSSNDNITYYLNARKLYRVAPNDTEFQTAVMAENVSKLEFRYYGRSDGELANYELTPPVGGTLDFNNRYKVKQIDMIVTVDIIEGKTINGSVTLSSPITLRSRLLDGH